MDIQMDFVSDWRDAMIELAKAQGLRFSPLTPKDQVVIRYLTYLRKTGDLPRPRRVHKSREFYCPGAHRRGLKKLLDCLCTGQDLQPYFSKDVYNLDFVDDMFNDWGVLHLHLGDRPYPKDPRFIDRTGPLLFLYLSDSDAYLINIYNHGDWSRESILQTVLNNWPHLLRPYVIQGATGVVQPLTDKQRTEARKAGMATFIELRAADGTPVVLVPPGLGMTTSRDPVQDVRTYGKIVDDIRALERYIRANSHLILQHLGPDIVEPLRLPLCYEAEEWLIVEPTSGKKFDGNFRLKGSLG